MPTYTVHLNRETGIQLIDQGNYLETVHSVLPEGKRLVVDQGVGERIMLNWVLRNELCSHNGSSSFMKVWDILTNFLTAIFMRRS